MWQIIQHLKFARTIARICFSYFWKILLSQERPTLILQYLHVNIFWIVHSDVIYWLFGRLLLNTFGKILKKLWLISTHVPNKQTGNSFLWKTIKHIDPNKTHRLGKKAKKRINAQGLLFGTLEEYSISKFKDRKRWD